VPCPVPLPSHQRFGERYGWNSVVRLHRREVIAPIIDGWSR
jgi:hypothetical protein